MYRYGDIEENSLQAWGQETTSKLWEKINPFVISLFAPIVFRFLFFKWKKAHMHTQTHEHTCARVHTHTHYWNNILIHCHRSWDWALGSFNNYYNCNNSMVTEGHQNAFRLMHLKLASPLFPLAKKKKWNFQHIQFQETKRVLSKF